VPAWTRGDVDGPSTETIGRAPRMFRSRADLFSGKAPWAERRQFDFLSADVRAAVRCSFEQGIDTVRKASLQDPGRAIASRNARRPPMFVLAAALGSAVAIFVWVV